LERLDATHRGYILRKRPDRPRTEAVMLAHGFTVDQMVGLVRAGLATATAERMVARSKAIEVATVRITEAGRRALGAVR
jgi:hypothetical protein